MCRVLPEAANGEDSGSTGLSEHPTQDAMEVKVGGMSDLALSCEELAAWILEVMEIQPGTEAWDIWYNLVVDCIVDWVSRRLLGNPFPSEMTD